MACGKVSAIPEGTILEYNTRTNTGFIETDSGDCVQFTRRVVKGALKVNMAGARCTLMYNAECLISNSLMADVVWIQYSDSSGESAENNSTKFGIDKSRKRSQSRGNNRAESTSRQSSRKQTSSTREDTNRGKPVDERQSNNTQTNKSKASGKVKEASNQTEAGGSKETAQDDNQKRARQRYMATVKVVKEDYAFVTPRTSLPESYTAKDVYIRLNHVSPKFLKIKQGDEVEFTLRNSGKDVLKGPQGLYVRIIKCANVDPDEVLTLLKDVNKKLISCKDTDNVNKEEEVEHLPQLVMDILSGQAFWKTVSENLGLKHECISEFIDLVLMLSDESSSCKSYFKNVIKTISDSSFMSSRKSILSSLVDIISNHGEILEINVRDIEVKIQKFICVVLQYLPSKAPNVLRIIKPLVKSNNEHFLYRVLEHVCKTVDADVSDLSWETLPLVPSTTELLSGPLSDSVNLRPLLKIGSYDSVEDYLDINFRLLRADCFDSVCKGIQHLLAGKLDERDMTVYYNIQLTGIQITQSDSGFGAAIKLTPQKAIKNWDHSRNLMFGNLLCFSPSGKFNDVIWAVVVNRDSMKTKGFVIVELCSECNTMDDSTALQKLKTCSPSALAVESPTYYRAYQPILKTLQKIEPSKLPFIAELVQTDENKSTQPAFIDDETEFKGSLIYSNINEPINVQSFAMSDVSPGETTLDASQEAAIKTLFKNRITIIQGPPGTGKTYIGVKMVQILNNIFKTKNKKLFPIVVLTYKNHALDEFTKSALKLFPGDVARIGGRSSDPELKQCALNELRYKHRPSAFLQDERNEIRRKIQEAKSDVENAIRELQRIGYFEWNDLVKRLKGSQLEALLFGCKWGKVKIQNIQGVVDEEGFKTIKEKYMNIKDVRSIVGSLPNPLDEYLEENKDTDRTRWYKIQELLETAVKAWLPEMESKNPAQQIISKLQNYIGKKKQESNNASDDEFDEMDADEELYERLSTMKQRDEKDLILFDTDNDSYKMMSSANEVDVSSLASLHMNLLLDFDNVWDMDQNDRYLLVQHLLNQKLKETESSFKNVISDYQGLVSNKNQIEDQISAEILKSKIVIAMTITGASINSDILRNLKPAVVIVEEAAEVLESQLLATIGEWTQQLILIGDHQQLKPPVECFELRKHFNMDMSLMERLILNKFPHAVLHMQNRMRPEFAELLKDIYPNLQSNLERVGDHKAPLCMVRPYFFWHHIDYEENPQNSRSVENPSEADRAINLALFFIQQGYRPSEITILGAYRGQVRLLRQKMKKEETKYPHLLRTNMDGETGNEYDSVKIHTIDLYQGDENEIVIVSLVRSNSRGVTGFLNTHNRRCVAQSRSKCGLYFIGNVNTISRSSAWSPLIDMMDKTDHVGKAIQLCCPRHPSSVLEATEAQDIHLGTFCKIECGQTNSCGLHTCKQACQPTHTHFHCNELVDFEFTKCGHQDFKKCWQNIDNLKCTKTIPFTSAECGHPNNRKCHQNDSDVVCKEKCSKTLPCGHMCDLVCWKPCDAGACGECEAIRQAELARQREEEERLRQEIKDKVQQQITRLKEEPDDVPFSLYTLSDTGDGAAEYFKVLDMVTKYIQPGHNWYPVIDEIIKITNRKLELSFLEARCQLFKPDEPDLKFHGTGVAAKIAEEGFKLGKSGMYGAGIYFASDSSKSAQEMYTKGTNELLLCQVLLGKSKTVTQAMPTASKKMLKQEGYDSLYAQRGTREKGGVLYDEFVVFNTKQAFPKYIIRYTKSSVNTLPKQLVLPAKFEKIDLKKSRSFDPSNELDVHYRIAESQFLRLMRTTGQNATIQSIEYYTNPDLMRKFELKKQELEQKYSGSDAILAESILAFHGTQPKNIDSIVRQNFDLNKLSTNTGDQGYFGAGIYFSENPHVSIGYGSSLLLCRVLPGKTSEFTAKEVGAKLRIGFDSHGYKPDKEGRYMELVIFDADQILPCYVIRL